MRKIYDVAEQMLLKDKFNNAEHIALINSELQNFLGNYAIFDSDDYEFCATLTDELTLKMEVKIKGFKGVNTNLY